MFRRVLNKRPRFVVGGHSVLEQDESSNHSGGGGVSGVCEYDDDSQSQQNSNDQTTYGHSPFVQDRPRRVQKPSGKSQHEDNTNLNACLDHLLRLLSRKDKEGFFQYPVTDQLAPGYSQIITRPMDFSTMKKKITNDDYSNIVEFRSDFELMCDNAMKYNRPETIYWQAAKKLLAAGTKLMCKEKLLSCRRSLECFARLTERELGFRIDSSSNQPSNDESFSNLNESLDTSTNDTDPLSSISISQACSQRKPKLILKLPKFYDKSATSTSTTSATTTTTAPIVTILNGETEAENDEIISTFVPVDDYPPEEMLIHAERAARLAREKLSARSSMTKYTLSFQRENRSSSLRLRNQSDRTQQTIPFVETSDDQKTVSASREFLEHGPFSSQAPQNESILSFIPKEDLDLLIQTYGSEFSANYAVSLMDFVKDAGDVALAYVDRFLSVLTNGEHDNFQAKKREKAKPPTVVKSEPTTSGEEANMATACPEQEFPPVSDTNQTIDGQMNDESKFRLETTQKIDDQDHHHQQQHECEQQQQQIQQQIQQQPEHQTHESEVSIPDYVFADLPDLSHLSNGPDQMTSTDLSMMNNNDTSFDAFE